MLANTLDLQITQHSSNPNSNLNNIFNPIYPAQLIQCLAIKMVSAVLHIQKAQ